jgi:hypothetical protein
MSRSALVSGAAAALTLAAAATAVAAGQTSLGGVTAQGFPVVVQVSASGKQVNRAAIGIEMKCNNGTFAVPDSYRSLPVSPTGRFGARFGPDTNRNPDGTTFDYQGLMTGQVNKARTKATGTWQLSVKNYDTSGNVTDSCAAKVHWTATQ